MGRAAWRRACIFHWGGRIERLYRSGGSPRLSAEGQVRLGWAGCDVGLGGWGRGVGGAGAWGRTMVNAGQLGWEGGGAVAGREVSVERGGRGRGGGGVVVIGCGVRWGSVSVLGAGGWGTRLLGGGGGVWELGTSDVRDPAAGFPRRGGGCVLVVYTLNSQPFCWRVTGEGKVATRAGGDVGLGAVRREGWVLGCGLAGGGGSGCAGRLGVGGDGGGAGWRGRGGGGADGGGVQVVEGRGRGVMAACARGYDYWTLLARSRGSGSLLSVRSCGSGWMVGQGAWLGEGGRWVGAWRAVRGRHGMVCDSGGGGGRGEGGAGWGWRVGFRVRSVSWWGC